MSKFSSPHLYDLIKSLTKAEKRHFKLCMSRSGVVSSPIVQLFDSIDRAKSLDEVSLFYLQKRSVHANHRALLYEKVLSSLRLLYRDKGSIRIKELFNYASLLHAKGLQKQSLVQLNKAKQLADKYQEHAQKLEIIEFEKKIENNYITRSPQHRAKKMVEEANNTIDILAHQSHWTNLSILLYDYYLKNGHTKSQSKFDELSAFFKINTSQVKYTKQDLEVYKFPAYVWFHYISQDFVSCYKYARKWVDKYEEYPLLLEPEQYMRALHNELSALYYCDDALRFVREKKRLTSFIERSEKQFNHNQHVMAFLYAETAQLNEFLLEGRFAEGATYCKHFEPRLEEFKEFLDISKVMVFWYKIAKIKFGNKEYRGALRILSSIISYSSLTLREDLHVFARLLALITHYELGDDDLIELQVKSTYRMLLKIKDFQGFHAAIFKFLQRAIHKDRTQLIDEFLLLQQEMIIVSQKPFEKHPFLYLDVIPWLESKIHRCSIEQVIGQKRTRISKNSMKQ